MSAHTSGPWRINTNTPSGATEIRSDDGNKPVAELWLHDQTIQNARLIAAAPELLDALRALAWAFEASIHDHEDSGAWLAAQAAIAKAEGKQ